MSLFILMHFSFGVHVGGLANAHFSPCNLSTNLVKTMSFRIAVMNFRDFSYELSDLKKKYTRINPAHLLHWGSVFQSTLKLVFLSFGFSSKPILLPLYTSLSSLSWSETVLHLHGHCRQSADSHTDVLDSARSSASQRVSGRSSCLSSNPQSGLISLKWLHPLRGAINSPWRWLGFYGDKTFNCTPKLCLK